ncbi:zinc knuckle CX2CX4HX4C containing protein [Tanacetum coccineum]
MKESDMATGNLVDNINNIKGKMVKDGKFRKAMRSIALHNSGTFSADLNGEVSQQAIQVKQLKKSGASGDGANVAIPLAAVEELSSRDGMEKVLENGPWLIRLVPIFLNIWTPNTRLTKDTITSAPIWVKMHNVPIVTYSEIRLCLITSQVGRPIMLDAYTSTICKKLWGKNDYARALIEVSSLTPMKDSIVVAIPFPDGTGHSLETDCPKYVKVPTVALEEDDGFTKPNKDEDGGLNQSSLPDPNKPPEIHESQPVTKSVPTYPDVFSKNSFETLMNRDIEFGTNDSLQASSSNNPVDDDEEDMEQVYNECDFVKKASTLSETIIDV